MTLVYALYKRKIPVMLTMLADATSNQLPPDDTAILFAYDNVVIL
jgi:hypothetical protein